MPSACAISMIALITTALFCARLSVVLPLCGSFAARLDVSVTKDLSSFITSISRSLISFKEEYPVPKLSMEV